MSDLERLHATLIDAGIRIVGVGFPEGRAAPEARIDFAPEATADERAAAAPLLATFDWSPAAHAAWLDRRRGVRSLHPYYFRQRFTTAEQDAIDDGALADRTTRRLLESLRLADTVGLDDPRTVAGVDYFIARGWVAAERRPAILADRRIDEKP